MILVSTLDSNLRLLDKANGKLLQSFSDAEFANSTYRLRSTLSSHDTVAVSGSEDGGIFAWDVLSGELVGRVQHNAETAVTGRESKKVVSAVAWKKRANEWASAGADGASRMDFQKLQLTDERNHRCLGRVEDAWQIFFAPLDLCKKTLRRKRGHYWLLVRVVHICVAFWPC